MKVLAVSDVVNRRLYGPQVREIAGHVDLIISCGDLPAYYLDYLVSSLSKPLLYVCGNHDEYDIPHHDSSVFGEKGNFYNVALDYNRGGPHFGGQNMHMKLKEFGGVWFSGLEGSIRYNRGYHQYSQSQIYRRLAMMSPALLLNRLFHGRALDVLITHSPPRGIHDKTDPAHIGYKALIPYIEKFRPKYLLHGHTHLYQHKEKRVTRYQDTTIINCYDYQILDLE